jgi:hypothetical protein
MNERAQDALRSGRERAGRAAGRMPTSRTEESRRENSAVVGRLHERAGVRLPEWQCDARSAVSGAQDSLPHDTPADKGPHTK